MHFNFIIVGVHSPYIKTCRMLISSLLVLSWLLKRTFATTHIITSTDLHRTLLGNVSQYSFSICLCIKCTNNESSKLLVVKKQKRMNKTVVVEEPVLMDQTEKI